MALGWATLRLASPPRPDEGLSAGLVALGIAMEVLGDGTQQV